MRKRLIIFRVGLEIILLRRRFGLGTELESYPDPHRHPDENFYNDSGLSLDSYGDHHPDE